VADEGNGTENKSRHDRELIELLNELRVALPGVQVLFAFLLTVAFSQRFVDVTSSQRKIYYVGVLCAATATAFLIAPSAFHRIQFREGDKEWLVRISNRPSRDYFSWPARSAALSTSSRTSSSAASSHCCLP